MPARTTVKLATVIVEHETGLRVRPTSMFVQTASRSETGVFVRKASGETEVDAKSSIAVLLPGVGPDEEIVITADGNDGEQAVERLIELARSDFNPDT